METRDVVLALLSIIMFLLGIIQRAMANRLNKQDDLMRDTRENYIHKDDLKEVKDILHRIDDKLDRKVDKE